MIHLPLKIIRTDEVYSYSSATCMNLYGSGLSSFVRKAFDDIAALFAGQGHDFQAIDLKFHDLEHTLMAATAMVCVMEGINKNHVVKGLIPQNIFELGLVSVLFHDTGYLKTKGDTSGTGAKYTRIHVERSCQIIGNYFKKEGLSEESIRSAEKMILCTGLKLDTSKIEFSSEQEKMTGYALGTGDLIGQMSDPAYISKLPSLYEEFDEAHRADPDDLVTPYFVSVNHLITNTPKFYREYVMQMLDVQLGGVFRLINDPYPSGANCYLDAIEENVSLIERNLF